MRFAILTAALGAACLATPANAGVTINFTSTGQARNFEGNSSPPQAYYAATLYGQFTINPAAGASSYSYVGVLPGFGSSFQVDAFIDGDSLALTYSRNIYMSANQYLFVTAHFIPGYLNGVIPTDIDFSKMINGFVQYHNQVCSPLCHGSDYYGDLVDLSATPTTHTEGSASATLVGSVPEPATWAMMIIGFGAMGTVMRRVRPAKVRFA